MLRDTPQFVALTALAIEALMIKKARAHKAQSAFFMINSLRQTLPTSRLSSSAHVDFNQAGLNRVIESSEPLVMSIPKRLLKRAVLRNAVKRVVREAWRASERSKYPAANTLLLKLTRVPSFTNTTALKRSIRIDVDQLFSQLTDNVYH
jgi:ribonuclease P protein component